MTYHRHPQARAEARHLVEVHDGSAAELVENALVERLEHDDITEALELDRVRREIESIYEVEGE